jgi:tetratricopeptide (TPR) repeat protein
VLGQDGTSRDKPRDSGLSAPERRLDSWKEIAAFLGRTERTAKRWEATQGLPIRRVPSSGRGSVFAYEHELRNWLDGAQAEGPASAGSSVRTAAGKWPVLAALAAVLVLLLLAASIFLAGRHDASTEALGTKDPVAADLYRSGQHEWQTRTPTGLRKAISDFQAAIAQDRRFAKAYLGLANAYILAREFDMMPAKAAYDKAADAVAQALKLDPQLSGAHAALAFVDFYGDHRAADAKREFAAAISLNPRDPIARHWYATFLMTTGDLKTAREEIEAAETLDSESTAIVADKALIMFYEGRAKDAAQILQQIEGDQPSFVSAHSYLAYMDLVGGDDQGYLRELKQFAVSRKDSKTTSVAALGADGLRLGGHAGMLRALLAARLSRFSKGDGTAYEIGQLYALLGDPAEALRFLQISAARSEPEIIGLKIDVLFRALRDGPDFKRLLTEIGLSGDKPKRGN